MPISNEIEDKQFLGLVALYIGAISFLLFAFYEMWKLH